MITLFRKFFGLAPYNRPAPTINDFKDTPMRTIAVATPRYSVRNIGDRWGLYEASGSLVRSYSRRRDAFRGMGRLLNA